MKKAIFAAFILLSTICLAPLSTCFAQQAERKFVTLNRPSLKGLPFSQAVLAGNTLYLSGTIGIDPKTGKPPASAEAEARFVMESFKEAVEAGGMAMDDVVMVQVFCSDLSLYETFNTVYASYFHGKFPARAFIGAGSLLRGGRFEVMGTAVKR
jgi:2-iminobutanoate/2-iminopropanoate deaminase